MPDPPSRRSNKLMALVGLALLGLPAAAWYGAARVDQEVSVTDARLTASVPAQSSVHVDGVSFDFVAECSSTGDDFLAAGSGKTEDGTPFFVVAEAPKTVSVAVGVSSDLDTPPAALPSYRTTTADLSRIEDRDFLAGTAQFVDTHGTNTSQRLDGSIRIHCPLTPGAS
jgi:hypothetical protein